ncbi:MAG: hypothetical protein IH621_18640 [Krumholzibacteria bacterium]|nr:hypothetical protein [Candidatus Krumholzibacteria bacterium]
MANDVLSSVSSTSQCGPAPGTIAPPLPAEGLINAIEQATGTAGLYARIQHLLQRPNDCHEDAMQEIAVALVALEDAEPTWDFPEATPAEATRILDDFGRYYEGEVFWARTDYERNLSFLDDAPVGAVPVRAAATKPDNTGTPGWKSYATSYLPRIRLNAAEEDILNYLDRTIVRRRGHGLRDAQRDRRMDTPLISARLAKNGAKCGVSTLNRARTRLLRLRLIARVGDRVVGRRLLRSYAPAWDPRLCDDPEGAFAAAAVIAQRGQDTVTYWQSDDKRKANDPVHIVDERLACKIEVYANSAFAVSAD